jgi:quercetin dioxygenase-like cupin family protein
MLAISQCRRPDQATPDIRFRIRDKSIIEKGNAMHTLIKTAIFAVLFGYSLATLRAQTLPAPTLDLQPDGVKWVTTPIPGVQTAVLSGSPSAQGLYLLRVKIAKDSKLMPHTHPDVRYTTVLAGEMHFGIGESFDDAKMKIYPPGAIIAIPANTPHFVWARSGDVIVQDTGIGPTGTTPVKK